MPCPKQNYRSKQNGHGVPCPYNTEREQIQDREAGLKLKTENKHTPLELRSSAWYCTGECSPQRGKVRGNVPILLSPPETGGEEGL